MIRSPWFSSKRRSPAPKPRQLFCEPLERREVMTAAVSYSLEVDVPDGQIFAHDSLTDSAGNVYIGGNFNSPGAASVVDFDPNNTYADNRDLVQDQVGLRGFIVKYNSAHTIDWLTRVTRGVTTLEAGASGAIYYTTLNSSGQALGRIGDLSSGAVTWESILPAYSGPDWVGGSFAVDEGGGRVYFAGTQAVDYYTGAAVRAFSLSAGGITGPTWTAVAAGTINGGNAGPADITISGSGASASIYVTGQFTWSADFDPGPGKLTLSSGAKGNYFTIVPRASYVWKLTSSGTLGWAGALPVLNNDSRVYASRISVSPSGQIIVAGNFVGAVDLDPGKGKLQPANAGSNDLFVLALTSSGALSYARSVGDATPNVLCDMTLDSTGNIFLLSKNLNPALSLDHGALVVTKLNNAGAFQWSAHVREGDGGQISVSSSGTINVTGIYWGDPVTDEPRDRPFMFWDELTED
jgi:hypothetical protein